MIRLDDKTRGKLDETRIVGGATGDTHIFKRKVQQSDSVLRHPKCIRFLVDFSGSMYRINSYDSFLQVSFQRIPINGLNCIFLRR